ncbi:MAG: TlpA disulfide reductase family protein [Fimbriimonadaceae bacterium]
MTTLLALIALSLQDKPLDIIKKDLPKEAECIVCTSGGEAHGKEKPAAGVMYKGIAYYFCNAKEVPVFKKDPEAFMPPVLPRPMAEFSMTDTSGKTWNAEAMKDKLVLIDFWATWCKPCKEMFPTLDKLYAKYHAKGLEMLSVSVDEKKHDLDKYLKGHQFPNPVLHDTTQTFGKWGVRNIPATFLIKSGQVIAQWTGKQTEKTLEAAISTNL